MGSIPQTRNSSPAVLRVLLLTLCSPRLPITSIAASSAVQLPGSAQKQLHRGGLGLATVWGCVWGFYIIPLEREPFPRGEACYLGRMPGSLCGIRVGRKEIVEGCFLEPQDLSLFYTKVQ